MKSDVRACIAYIAAHLITERDFVFLLDCSRNLKLQIHGHCHEHKIDILERKEGVRITGSAKEGKTTLYNHEGKYYIEMNICQHKFGGYDHGSSCHFSGEVKEDSVWVYDFSESDNFEYRFCP